MKCEDVRDWLVAYARGELDEARQIQVEEHLARCSGCAAELEDARRVLALTQVADDTSTGIMAQEIIQDALHRHATDIHLEWLHDEGRVRLRVDGVLQLRQSLPREQLGPLVQRLKMMAAMNLKESQLPQDGRILLRTDEAQEYDLRVSMVPTLHGENLVIRILDRSSLLIGLNKLGILDRPLSQIEELIRRPQGLLIATGPTGSGKTTLLYSILHRLNRPEVKILTIEDPVEYALPGLTQVHVNRKAGLTFAPAIRAFLRQDPDVMMAGEVRDLETAELLIQAAMTGHLVLTCLHTRDTIEAVIRLQQMGAQAFLVASAVTGVVGQRLVRRICPTCKESYSPSEPLLSGLEWPGSTRPSEFYHGAGCEQCAGAGYRGRVGLFEVLTLTGELSRLVSSGAAAPEIRSQALETDSLWTFAMDAGARIAQGLTTAEEVDRVLMGH